MAEAAQGRRRLEALKTLPALLALGAGLAPHNTRAVLDGLRSMAGEFVRTPKAGVMPGARTSPASKRYRARADVPFVEIALCFFSLLSTVASLETGHWFATPFAMLFTFGYGYVAALVMSEQAARRKAALLAPVPRPSDSLPPVAPSETDVEELAA